MGKEILFLTLVLFVSGKFRLYLHDCNPDRWLQYKWRCICSAITRHENGITGSINIVSEGVISLCLTIIFKLQPKNMQRCFPSEAIIAGNIHLKNMFLIFVSELSLYCCHYFKAWSAISVLAIPVTVLYMVQTYLMY